MGVSRAESEEGVGVQVLFPSNSCSVCIHGHIIQPERSAGSTCMA